MTLAISIFAPPHQAGAAKVAGVRNNDHDSPQLSFDNIDLSFEHKNIATHKSELRYSVSPLRLEGYYEKDAAAPRPRKRLVVTGSRRKRACKQAGDANVTFCGKGGAAE